MKLDIVYFLPLFACWLAVTKRTGAFFGPDSILVIFNTITLLGTAIIVDQSPGSESYFWLVLGSTSLAVAAITIARATWPRRYANFIAVRETPTTLRLVSLLALAAAISLAYYFAVGYIVLISSGGSAADISTARLNSYAGSRYLFPGYVNQFKNILLPALAAATIHSIFARRAVFRWPLGLLLAAFSFIMVAGTGQRGAMVLASLTISAALVASRTLRGRHLAVLAATFMAAFAFQTALLGRQSRELATATGASEKTLVFAQALWSRVALENPMSGLAAYRYTETLPYARGREWLLDLAGILPGNRGSDLSSRVFETLYGSRAGTAPPSTWGSIYYNFGPDWTFIVVVLLALSLTWLTFHIYRVLSRDTPITFLRLLAACGMAVSLGGWVAGSILAPLNQGFPMYALLFVLEPWVTRSSRRELPRGRHPSSATQVLGRSRPGIHAPEKETSQSTRAAAGQYPYTPSRAQRSHDSRLDRGRVR